MKAIRTTYNIFLLSKSANTQMVAQATLAQMIEGVFQRIPPSLSAEAQRKREEEAANPQTSETTASAESGHANGPTEKEQDREMKGSASADSMYEYIGLFIETDFLRMANEPRDATFSAIQEASKSIPVRSSNEIIESMNGSELKSSSSRDCSYDLPIKDAYLVFRALCKLSMKSLPSDG